MTDKPKAPETIAVTVRLPKALHAKLTAIAEGEKKTAAEIAARSVREMLAQYGREQATVTKWVKKKG